MNAYATVKSKMGLTIESGPSNDAHFLYVLLTVMESLDSSPPTGSNAFRAVADRITTLAPGLAAQRVQAVFGANYLDG